MTTITVGDKYKIDIDEWNHTLSVMQEPTMITTGKHKGTMSKGGWSVVGYFPNVAQAVSKITQMEVNAEIVYTLAGYIAQLEAIYDKMKESIVVEKTL
jgi:hypothetical protein